MLFDPNRHEPLTTLGWDERCALNQIDQIVQDTEDHFDNTLFWPPHPRDINGPDLPKLGLTPFYYGAGGVIWALHYLQSCGGIQLKRDYFQCLESVRLGNQAWLDDIYLEAAASYLMGDTPFLLVDEANTQDRMMQLDKLRRLIVGNMEHPHRELMWGSPGTMLAALFLYERSGDSKWASMFRSTAAKLWSQLNWSEEFSCSYWTQSMYGKQSTFLDGVHGFAATAFVLIKGHALLDAALWAGWQACIVNTIQRTAILEEGRANWPAHLIAPEGAGPRLRMQFCHGAPGFVVCLSDMPSRALDPLLCSAGEAAWHAGPLKKGGNLCHGTGGNGYAFLKLFQRTNDPKWLHRARCFAMHAITQAESDRATFGQGHYSLWTGDLGLAIYLRDCVTGQPKFPMLDVIYPTVKIPR